MKKVVDFLEANVQWVALGLGVLWVLWMAWGFAINKPVAVKIGNEEMAPGSVDPYIVEHAVSDVRGKMERPVSGFNISTAVRVVVKFNSMRCEQLAAVPVGSVSPLTTIR